MRVFILTKAHAQIWLIDELIEGFCSQKVLRKLMSFSHQFAIAPKWDMTQVISRTRFFLVSNDTSCLLPFSSLSLTTPKRSFYASRLYLKAVCL